MALDRPRFFHKRVDLNKMSTYSDDESSSCHSLHDSSYHTDLPHTVPSQQYWRSLRESLEDTIQNNIPTLEYEVGSRALKEIPLKAPTFAISSIELT